jgi:CheY-like chemotaxis protein
MVSAWEPAGRASHASGEGRLRVYVMLNSGTFSADMMNVPENRMPDDVLVVEDDPIIALDFEDTISGFGVKTVRAAATVARALKMIEERAPDFALLDVGLMREKSFAVAERLDELGIPFAFVTGYGAEVKLPAAFKDRPRLPKPCASDALEAVLRGYRAGR